MPTGIEEAGLVMAAFPLVVCLIDEYKQGLDLIKKWTRYKKSLQSLRRNILVEEQVVQNACYKLFQDVLGNDSTTTAKLFGDKMAELWADKAIEEKFKARLGRKQWEIFAGIFDEILNLLGCLLAELQKNIPISRSSPLSLRLTAFWARFTFVFSHQEGSMQTLRELVSRFQHLVDGVKIRRTEMRILELPGEFRSFRQSACDLCEAINRSFRGACTQRHMAILGLRNASEPFLSLDASSNSLVPDETFEIMFCAGDEWMTAAAKPRSHHSAEHCLEINDLCVHLHHGPVSQNPVQCLGFLAAGHPNEDKCYCLGVGPNDEERKGVISLHQLLCSQQQHTSFPFYERDRLKLAIILSTSMLRLHSTPWLQDMWTSRDILFRPYRDDFDNEAVLRPYVSQTFPNIHAPGHAQRNDPMMVRNAALYALGKILIQLIESRPLVNNADGPQVVAGADVDPELPFAIALERTIDRKAGRTWSDVIRRCLYCDFGVPTEEMVLDNDDFFRRVYSGVIHPLIAALNHIGEPL